MNIARESLHSVRMDAIKHKKGLDPRNNSNLELCRIESVDEDNMTVTLYLLDSKFLAMDVPYQFPFYHEGHGIMFMPSKGSLGIAGHTAKGTMLLMYAAPEALNENFKLTRNIENLERFNLPKLKPGEVFIKSKEGAFVLLDRDSNLTVSSGSFAIITLDKHGKITLDGEEIELFTNSRIKEIYMNGYETYMEIIKGMHTYKPIHETEDSIELVYRLDIKNGDKNTFFGLDLDGNIHTNFTGEIIKH